MPQTLPNVFNFTLSDFTFVPSITLANSFVGKLYEDDHSNSSDILGDAMYPIFTLDSFDWSHFENPSRTWGQEGGNFPSDDNRGPWQRDRGRIWDWSLANTDNVVRAVNPLPTADDTIDHDIGLGSTITALRHAYEIEGDGIGNDNWLCESNEACIYMPNLGAYQGHGGLDSNTLSVDGVNVSGITLKKFRINGR